MQRRIVVRVIVLTICPLLAAVAATGTPAPVYRPKPSTPWVTGWDKPVDPLGDCRFTKSGDKLTIHLPGTGHEFDDEYESITAPHLLRQVEGDFDLQVRIGGDFRCPKSAKGDERRGAGILITDGTVFVRFGLNRDQDDCIQLLAVTNRTTAIARGKSADSPKPVALRIEKRNKVLTLKYRDKRETWSVAFSWAVPLPKTVKVGVFAECMIPGVFEPVFDQFALTPAK